MASSKMARLEQTSGRGERALGPDAARAGAVERAAYLALSQNDYRVASTYYEDALTVDAHAANAVTAARCHERWHCSAHPARANR